MTGHNNSLLHLFDQLNGWLFLTNLNGVIIYSNAAIVHHNGFQVNEIIGHRPQELWGGHMHPSFYEHLWHAIGKDQRPFINTVNNAKKNSTVLGEENFYITPIVGSQDTTYYMKLQPFFTTVVERLSFESEFLHVFSKQPTYSGVDLLRWIVEHLINTEQTQLVHAIEEQLAQISGNLSDILHQYLITPFSAAHTKATIDSALVKNAQYNTEKFELLYTKYYKKIYAYVFYHTNQNADIAEELTQDVFTQAYSHLKNFHIMNISYHTYLLSIAHNIVINYYRKHKPILLDDIGLEQLHSKEDDHAGLLIEEILSRCQIVLSRTESQVIALMYKDNLSIHEIAQTIHKTDNAIKLLLSHARKKMRKLLPDLA